MTTNKSNSRDGIAISRLSAGNNSNVQFTNKIIKIEHGIEAYKTQPLNSNAVRLGGMMFLGVLFFSGMIFDHFQKSSEVEKWMDVPAAIAAFAPEANNDLDQSTKEVDRLQKEVQIAKEELALKVEMVNLVPSYDQKRIDNLQNNLKILKENNQNIVNSIVIFFIKELKSGQIIATGYDQTNRHWVCPTPSDWEDLNLSGTLTKDYSGNSQISIIGGRSGRVHLIWARLGKPLAAAKPNLLCQGPGIVDYTP